jgi:hypothetical protein
MRYKMQIKELLDEKHKLVSEHDETSSKLQKNIRELKLELQMCEKDRFLLK